MPANENPRNPSGSTSKIVEVTEREMMRLRSGGAVHKSLFVISKAGALLSLPAFAFIMADPGLIPMITPPAFLDPRALMLMSLFMLGSLSLAYERANHLLMGERDIDISEARLSSASIYRRNVQNEIDRLPRPLRILHGLWSGVKEVVPPAGLGVTFLAAGLVGHGPDSQIAGILGISLLSPILLPLHLHLRAFAGMRHSTAGNSLTKDLLDIIATSPQSAVTKFLGYQTLIAFTLSILPCLVIGMRRGDILFSREGGTWSFGPRPGNTSGYTAASTTGPDFPPGRVPEELHPREAMLPADLERGAAGVGRRGSLSSSDTLLPSDTKPSVM